MEKLNVTQQKQAFTNQKKCRPTTVTTQNKQKNKPGVVAFYDTQPGNRAGLFSKKKWNGGDK